MFVGCNTVSSTWCSGVRYVEFFFLSLLDDPRVWMIGEVDFDILRELPLRSSWWCNNYLFGFTRALLTLCLPGRTPGCAAYAEPLWDTLRGPGAVEVQASRLAVTSVRFLTSSPLERRLIAVNLQVYSKIYRLQTTLQNSISRMRATEMRLWNVDFHASILNG